MENKRKKIVISLSISVAVVLMFTVLMSYAYWKMQKIQSGTNDIIGACLDIDIEESGANGFTLDNAWPVTDEEGQNQGGYSFTIKNKCESSINYEVVLDSLVTEHPEKAMNANYIKVKLDNQGIKRYGSLEDAEESNPNALVSKTVYNGTIPGKENDIDGEVSHNIKIWISDDSPATEAGTEFSSRVRIVAGQGIGSNQTGVASSLKLLSDPNEPDVTISNIQVGDLVGYQTEQFYVIGIDGNNVKLLSRYLLNVGDYKNLTLPEGLQSNEIGCNKTDLKSHGEDSININWYDEQNQTIYGAVPFSNDDYWWDSSNNVYVSPYSQNSFVYNNQSTIRQYIDAYVNTLIRMGLSVTNGTLLSIEEVSTLCNTSITSSKTGDNDLSNCPGYLFETSYWLGSIAEHDVWEVFSFDDITTSYYDFGDKYFGVRPVITVTLSNDSQYNNDNQNVLTYPISGTLDNGITYELTSDGKMILGGTSEINENNATDLASGIVHQIVASRDDSDVVFSMLTGEESYAEFYDFYSNYSEEGYQEVGLNKEDFLAYFSRYRNLISINTIEFTNEVASIKIDGYSYDVFKFQNVIKLIASNDASINISLSERLPNLVIERRLN